LQKELIAEIHSKQVTLNDDRTDAEGAQVLTYLECLALVWNERYMQPNRWVLCSLSGFIYHNNLTRAKLNVKSTMYWKYSHVKTQIYLWRTESSL